jgi:N-glycosylase/DNA lyase
MPGLHPVLPEHCGWYGFCFEFLRVLSGHFRSYLFNAEKSIKIQEEIDDGLLTFSESELAKELKKSGHRFPNIRAKYIVEARMHEESINRIILSPGDEQEQRDWLAKNIKGIGYKEASHFLRNIGFTDLAIIDFHIIDLLTRLELIQKPKNLGKKKYLEIEKLLRNASIKLNMNLAELDLYMWYMLKQEKY